jgi:hypothetical protein
MFTVSTAQFVGITDILQRWSVTDTSTMTGYISSNLSAPLATLRGFLITQEVADLVDVPPVDVEDLRIGMPVGSSDDSHTAVEAETDSSQYGDADEDNYQAITDGD